MKQHRNTFKSLALFTAVLMLLAGTAGMAQAEKQPVTITFWGGWTGPDAETMRGIVEAYTKDNPHVTIEFETQQWSPLFTRVFAEASNGTAPDILAMHPLDVGQFAAMGLLDAEMAGSIGLDPAQYSKTAWEGGFYDGVLYGLPLDLHMHGLYYNRICLRKPALKPRPRPVRN